MTHNSRVNGDNYISEDMHWDSPLEMIRYFVVWDGGEWGPYSEREIAENAKELAWQLKYPNVRVEERV